MTISNSSLNLNSITKFYSWMSLSRAIIKILSQLPLTVRRLLLGLYTKWDSSEIQDKSHSHSYLSLFSYLLIILFVTSSADTKTNLKTLSLQSPQKEIFIVLPYLGFQTKAITQQLKSCIYKFYGCF